MTLRAAAGCTAGVEWAYATTLWSTRSSVAFDSGSSSLANPPRFHGSFIASVTGEHCFSMTATQSDTTSGIASVEFVFEGVPSGVHETYYNICMTLEKDYRYSMSGRTGNSYKSVKVWLYVSWPGEDLHIVGTRSVEICETSGCRDLDLDRSPYDCQPSPTEAQSVTATRSVTFPFTPALSRIARRRRFIRKAMSPFP
jgi:hypothetical protein